MKWMILLKIQWTELVKMSSVQGEQECPKCRDEHCFWDSFYKTGELHTRCDACGFWYD